MTTHQPQRARRARTAVAALLTSCAVSILGPVAIAAADPAPDNVVGARPTEDRGDFHRFSPGHILVDRHVVDRRGSGLEPLRLQQVVERSRKSLALVSNVMKKLAHSASGIVDNIK